MDIDFFKPYNDNYGHSAGDDCLRLVGASLTDGGHRPSDLMARYGGEEFVCVLPGANMAGAERICEGIRRGIEALNIPHAHSAVTDHVTLSLGCVTMIPTLDTSPLDLIKAADKNLYRAKEGGRNRLVCSSRIPIRKYKILLVDDDESFRVLCRPNLQSLDLSINLIIAENGVDGLIKMGMEMPDVLITDLQMPEMDGVMMINRIRECPEFDTTLLIAVSAMTLGDVKQLGSLPDDVIFSPKPVDFDRLKATILEELHAS